MKDWNDIKSHDSWEIFKIMGEFVEGFERLSRIGPCVSIFGSARTNLDSKYYTLAEELAFQLTQKKFGVITGGGPGIMEAGNKGAKRGGGKSVGSLSDVRGNLLRDLNDVADSDGVTLGGNTVNVKDGGRLVFNKSSNRFETTTTLGRTDRPNQVQTINGGEY